MYKWTLDATIENVETITGLIDEKLEEAGASMKAEMDRAASDILSRIPEGA